MASNEYLVLVVGETFGWAAETRMAIEDKFKINLNQNLWGMVVSYVTTGLSQRYGFHELWWLSFVVACVMSLSVLICIAFYTFDYCQRKAVPKN